MVSDPEGGMLRWGVRTAVAIVMTRQRAIPATEPQKRDVIHFIGRICVNPLAGVQCLTFRRSTPKGDV